MYVYIYIITGFRLCWDNTQINVTRRHQGTTGKNQMKLWANCYAAQDMVNVTYHESSDVKSAIGMPLELLLQTPKVAYKILTRDINYQRGC